MQTRQLAAALSPGGGGFSHVKGVWIEIVLIKRVIARCFEYIKRSRFH